MIACGFLFFNLMGSIGDMVLQYRLKMQYSALAEFLSKLVSISALVIVILLRGNFLWVIFSSVALSGIAIFVFKWYFARKYTPINISFDKALSKWIFNLAWPMGIVFIANNLFFRLDSIMLFVIKGAEAVGIYSVAYKILEVTVFFGSYFASSLKPVISRNIDKNSSYIKGIIEKSFIITLLISLPIAIVSIAFSKEIIAFLSNSSFTVGGHALTVLSIALPFLYFDVLLGEILIANDERRLLLKISSFILLFNFTFNLVFIPRYSFMGAAYGTLISEVILFAIFLFFTRRLIPYKIDSKNLLKLGFISLLTLLFTFLVKALPFQFLILSGATLAFFYFMVWCLGIISLQTVKELVKPN
jgi:O-antigen/teichoic acid export membrane protein